MKSTSHSVRDVTNTLLDYTSILLLRDTYIHTLLDRLHEFTDEIKSIKKHFALKFGLPTKNKCVSVPAV